MSRDLRINFFSPANAALTGAKNRRECPLLSDGDWLRMGTRRVLGDVRSGREFLQQWKSGGRSGDRRGSLFSRLLRVRAGCAWSAKSTIPSPRRYRNTRIPVFSDYEDFNKFVGLPPGTAITLAPAPMRRPSGERNGLAVVFLHSELTHPCDDALE